MILYLLSATSSWMVGCDCLNMTAEIIICNEISLHTEQQWGYILRVLMLMNATAKFATASMWEHNYIEKFTLQKSCLSWF